MKNILKFLLLLVVMSVVFLAACNSEDTSTDSQNEDSETTNKDEKVKITFQAWGNPAEIEVYNRAVDAFMEENPNITVEMVPSPGEQYEQKLLTSLQGSSGPDVFYAHEPTMAKMIEAGIVEPLNDFFATEDSYSKLEDFPEGLYGPAKKDGQYYGVTPDVNPMVIYYNKGVFEEAGVKTPQEYYDEGNWNWDTFEEVTSQLMAADKKGFVLENWWGHWYSWIWSNGGQIFDENGKLVLHENEKGQEGIKFMDQLVQNGNAIYAGSLPQGQGVDAMFMSNQVGMISGGRWFTPQFDQNPNLDYDYIYLPSNTDQIQNPVGVPVAYMAVNGSSKNKEAAMKFVSYYVGQQGQELRTGEGGSAMPSHPDADNATLAATDSTKHFNYFLDARNNGFTHGSNLAYDAQYPGLSADIEEEMDLMFLGKQDAETTIDHIVELIKEREEATQ
ncbi:ABC transporter substrate-binding protein [Bacillus suaedae]|uniref:Sugar ABC transporter substrate-binding protein n=1 Tax=Halalkalibacter suaedae TaxID=2822140 RepID=A0A940WVA0_9BACI|nr:sugar ABC transporter substrate-binding protein [Bacillus suaedae]MBP3950943.1 sugar ABC transporter substrate-binding protein [Bacillus suaedae]